MFTPSQWTEQMLCCRVFIISANSRHWSLGRFSTNTDETAIAKEKDTIWECSNINNNIKIQKKKKTQMKFKIHIYTFEHACQLGRQRFQYQCRVSVPIPIPRSSTASPMALQQPKKKDTCSRNNDNKVALLTSTHSVCTGCRLV